MAKKKNETIILSLKQGIISVEGKLPKGIILVYKDYDLGNEDTPDGKDKDGEFIYINVK